MIATIIDNNTDRIKADLVNRGLTYDRLIDDILDHVCCMIEEQMIAGKDFELSYNHVLDTIGDKRLPEIQHQTLLLLNKNFQRMKNLTYLFGLSAALVAILGAFFKRMHWPGAGILITAGIVFVIFVFLPLYFVINYREQAEKKNPLYAIVGYLTLASLLAGAIFKIQHWPGAGHIIEAGLVILIIGFIPLYVVNVFQRAGKHKISLPYIVMLLIGIAIVSLFYNVNMSKNQLDIYRNEAIKNESCVDNVQDRIAQFMILLNDTAYADKKEVVADIHARAVSLQVLVDEMKDGMLSYVKQPGVRVEDISKIDNRNAGRNAVYNSGKGREFTAVATEYKEMLEELIEDPVTISQIEDHLDFINKILLFEFGTGNFRNDPLMKSYNRLTYASKGVALSEYVAISSLLH
ncbi:MAG: hypothetical protein J7K53_10405 [Bacteroidales bacterium]|nr:hypothetical protein [Bacteroidales bacterium]